MVDSAPLRQLAEAGAGQALKLGASQREYRIRGSSGGPGRLEGVGVLVQQHDRRHGMTTEGTPPVASRTKSAAAKVSLIALLC